MATAYGTRTVPYSWYVDPAVLRLEQERIFARTWQYVARQDQLAEPGCFVAAHAGHVPIVIVRGRDEQLRGFVNVCRHRGSLVCEGHGRRASLQCPYHAWTYELDGSLRSAPRAERSPGFERDELGLVPVAVETWGPLVFANPAPDAAPLTEQLGELPALLADGGVDVDALEFRLRVEADEYACNWKVCIENYLECYHCAVAHPSFSQAIDVTQDRYLLETHPTFSSQLAVARDGGGGVYDAAGEVTRAQFHLLFPNTLINVMPGRLNLSIGPVLPAGAERANRHLDYFFADDVDETWLQDYLALDAVVGAEDRVLVERVQAGIGSGAVTHGRLLPESEQLIAHFQSLLVEALGADDAF